ncbi:MAG: Maf family nucleotide pyrophosphatase [Bacteroidales bacterium]|nr:Maf family nucleotide pyrophosphatase [Bacteroidales bacterium]
MSRIILASGSPRRRELMAALDIPFTVDTLNFFEEGPMSFTDPARVPLAMAEGKSQGFHRELEDDEVLVTADTVVVLRDKEGNASVIGKPHSREDAVDMLGRLSGKVHEVITAVVIRNRVKKISFTDSTLVTFRDLTDEEIDYYIDRYRPFDKAGSYGVQEWIGYVGIERIEGSFYNVMGFPVHRVYREIAKFVDYGTE